MPSLWKPLQPPAAPSGYSPWPHPRGVILFSRMTNTFFHDEKCSPSCFKPFQAPLAVSSSPAPPGLPPGSSLGSLALPQN